MILSITQKELRNLFISPLGWSMLGVAQFILSFVFVFYLDEFIALQPQLLSTNNPYGVSFRVIAPMFSWLGILGLLFLPLLTMGLISDELRKKTLILLLSSPIATAHIVLGKFLAMLIFIVIFLCMPLLMAGTLSFFTHLDGGHIFTCFLGTLLMLSAFAAIGLFISSLTRHPTTAAVITFGALLMLSIVYLNAAGQTSQDPVIEWLSVIHHQQAFSSGLVNTADVIYYILFVGLFLLLTIRRLEALRLQN